MHPGAISWVSGQLNLWNVAITRARTHLIMVGDKDLWHRQGGVAAALQDAVEHAPYTRENNRDELLRRLYQALSAPAGTTVTLGECVNGHPADALVRTADSSALNAVLLDPGPDDDNDDAARHLRLMLHRRKLLDGGEQGGTAMRYPAWRLYDVNGG